MRVVLFGWHIYCYWNVFMFGHPSAAALLFSFLVLCACTRSRDIEGSGDNAVAEHAEALQKAEQVADKVREKARRSEKKEGSQDLVKDDVSVKTNPEGDPVIEQTGEASRYAKSFQGKKTANGEKFDQKKLTAAHPALPLGTKATVTNLENGKSVDVRINDRGPYVKGRDIDLSPSAAKALDITKNGIAPVKIEAQLPPTETSDTSESSSASEKTTREK
jgi:rare lipoprotein A (peptidoglycan hydrolase)